MPRRRDRSRPFDLVLFGATGFTGRLVAEYIARNYGTTDLRWALAGRNWHKLEAVRDELSGISASAGTLELIAADSADPVSLDAVASRAGVVCTTVGPYARHGSGLVAACIRRGTDYCDITGEVPWIREMIDRHHEEAERTGARIVHCCGFDSIPSDLGTLLVQEHALERYGVPCREVKLFVTKTRGGASGGTIASVLNVLEQAQREPNVRRLLGDPYSLNPEGERRGPDGPDWLAVRRDPDLPGWTAPFVMAAVNTRIVRRTNALSGYRYGRDFSYHEAVGYSGDIRGLGRATGLTLGLGAFAAGVAVPPVRHLLEKRVLPKPGQGPNAEQRRRGHFEIELVGKGEGKSGPFVVRARVVGTSDPGYGETSKMLGEAAVCLALEGASLTCSGGLLTPATAMGSRLISRLCKAGMTFEITS